MSRQVLRIYEDDDTTVALEFSTSAADPLPYLKEGLNTDDQEIDIRTCAATIGAITCELVDHPTIPGDQDSGAVTAVVADGNGETLWIGHRAEFLQEPHGGGALFTVFDGIVGSINLLDTLVTYQVGLEDITARGRKVSLFGYHETASMIPSGPINGFGRIRDGFADTYYAVPPALTVAAAYTQVSASSGYLRLSWALGKLTQDIWEAALAQPVYNDVGSFLRYAYSRVVVRWRASAADTWKTFRNIPQSADPVWPAALKPSNADNPNADVFVWVAHDPDEAVPPALPVDGQAVQVQVLYAGPPTEAFPLYLEGPAGEVLKSIIDGDYSDEPLRIRYDAARMTALADEVEDLFAEIDEPAEDAREWLNEHWYGAFGYLPTLRDGELYPVRLEMPDASPTLELDDSNIAHARWGHDRADGVTVVEYSFFRHDVSLPIVVGPGILPGVSGSIQSSRREVTHVYRSTASVTVGEQVVRFKPVTVREIVGMGYVGDFGVLAAKSVAQRRGLHLLDRLRFGAQRVTVKASRHDADVDAANVGDWAILGASWLPEYGTLTRGANRLTQIVAARNLDQRWREFVLLDAGPDNQPLDQPTIGALTANDDGTVEVPVTAIPEGEAAVYYAVAAAQPPAASGLWLLASRLTAPDTVVLPPAPEGSTVHVRVRAEAEGRIYSASVYDDIGIPLVPRVRQVRIELVDGAATIFWSTNASALGVRIEYSTQADIESPALDQSIDLDAADGSYAFPLDLEPGTSIVARITPYSGWTGAAVSGTPGPAQDAYASRPGPIIAELRNVRVLRVDDDTLKVVWEPGEWTDEVYIWYTEQPADATTDPWPSDIDAPDEILITGTDPDEWEFPEPADGSLGYLQLEPRWERPDGLLVPGPVWRAVITPAGFIITTDIAPVLDEDAGTLYLAPNRNEAAGSVRWAIGDTEAAARAAVATGTVSTDSLIEVHTFTQDMEVKWVAVQAYPEADGTGTPGPDHALPHTYHAANDRPSVSVMPFASTDPTKVGLRLVATDDSGTVALYYRTYEVGGVVPAYTRDPVGVGFAADPLVADLLVTLPIAGAPHVAVEAYAEDDAGNVTARALYLEIDENGFGAQPTVDKDWMEGATTATVWLSYVATGLIVTDVHFRSTVGSGSPSAWLAATRDAGDASTVKGGLLGSGEYEFDITLDVDRISTIEGRLTLSNGEYVFVPFPAFDRNRSPNYVNAQFDSVTLILTVSWDADTKSQAVLRTDGGGVESDEADGPFALFDMGALGMTTADRWVVDLVGRSDPIDDIDGSTLESVQPMTLTGSTWGAGSDPQWLPGAAGLSMDPPDLADSVVTITVEADGAGSGHDIHFYEQHRFDTEAWSSAVDITALTTPSAASDAPPTTPTAYEWDATIGRVMKPGVHTYYQRITAEIETSGGVVVDSRTIERSWYTAEVP